MQKWTIQVDDLIGGWILTDYPYPPSEWDLRPDGDKTKRPSQAANFWGGESSRDFAEHIATLLNASAALDEMIEGE